jgi:hypothetical protein
MIMESVDDTGIAEVFFEGNITLFKGSAWDITFTNVVNNIIQLIKMILKD